MRKTKKYEFTRCFDSLIAANKIKADYRSNESYTLLSDSNRRMNVKLIKNKMILVKIGWADAIENLNGWHTKKEALKWAKNDNWIVHQVGWVLEETNDYVLFSSRWNEASSGRKQTFSGLFKIPKPWIKYKIEL